MALNGAAVFKPTTGHYYTAAVGTAYPADPTAPPVAWTEIGHTSIEDLLGVTSEGGEVTVLGTLQNAALRTSTSARTETMTFILQQADAAGLKLYYGSNMGTSVTGLLTVPTNPTPTTVAFLVVFRDGVNFFAFYAPKVEISRGDDLALEDTENFMGLPLAVRPLQHNTNDWAYAVSPLT